MARLSQVTCQASILVKYPGTGMSEAAPNFGVTGAGDVAVPDTLAEGQLRAFQPPSSVGIWPLLAPGA